MLGDISGATNIYIITGYTDMRKSVDGLCAIVMDQMKEEPNGHSIYLFCGKRCGRIRVLLREPDGYVLLYKQLGIQAIANTSDDLRPSSQNGTICRDYEYKRLGTVSLLATIDLLTSEAIPLVSDTHKIRIILDNHSAHTSKETKNFLTTMPEGRFEFVFTPKHGSWLSMIESFFSKMTKQMLRGIGASSKLELMDRIYLYFQEINKEPVVYHWKYKMDEITEDEAESV